MTIDDRRLGELLNESNDLHHDALRTMPATLSDVRDYAHESGDRRPDPAELDIFNRRRMQAATHIRDSNGARLVGGAALVGALATLVGRPASADQALDIQMLQTASSLERLAINTYKAALGLPFIASGNATVKAFAETTMSQHDEHRQAFQALTESMGATAQDEPNPVFQKVVDEAVPTLMAPIDVVNLAAALEEVATETYLFSLTMFEDTAAKELMGSVMGVECQHLAVLLAVAALLNGGGEALIMIPTDVAALPAAAGSAAFPEPFNTINDANVAPAESGAVS